MLRRRHIFFTTEQPFLRENDMMAVAATDRTFHLYPIRFLVDRNRYVNEEMKVLQSETFCLVRRCFGSVDDLMLTKI